MSVIGNNQQIDFTVDVDNLYREESVTDLKVASIRQLIPIKADGTDDPARTTLYIGHTQLMSPEGPLPLQAELDAGNMDEAMAAFPAAMQAALEDMIQQLQELRRQEQQNNDSRIIMPNM